VGFRPMHFKVTIYLFTRISISDLCVAIRKEGARVVMICSSVSDSCPSIVYFLLFHCNSLLLLFFLLFLGLNWSHSRRFLNLFLFGPSPYTTPLLHLLFFLTLIAF
jgi:hypothetical protein